MRMSKSIDLGLGIGRRDRVAYEVAVDGNGRVECGHDDDVMLPKDLAGVNQGLDSADHHADDGEEAAVIDLEPEFARGRHQLRGRTRICARAASPSHRLTFNPASALASEAVQVGPENTYGPEPCNRFFIVRSLQVTNAA